MGEGMVMQYINIRCGTNGHPLCLPMQPVEKLHGRFAVVSTQSECELATAYERASVGTLTVRGVSRSSALSTMTHLP